MTDSRNPEVELRDALDQLTQPHDTEIRDGGRHLATRTDPALLIQLRKARTASIGPGNGSRARHERGTLNINASELYTAIETRTRRWALRAGYNRTTNWPPTDQLLRHWYTLTYGRPDFDPTPYLHTLKRWIAAITDLLDPPHRFDIDKPCPTCGAHIIDTKIDGQLLRVRALHGIERGIYDSVVTCRNCGATWFGVPDAEALNSQLHTSSTSVQDINA
jgi:hypothetical protein